MDLDRLINALAELSTPTFNRESDLQTWKGMTVNVLNRIYGVNSNQEEQIKSIKFRRHIRVSTVGSRPSGPNHNGSDCAKQANQLLVSFIKDLQAFGIPGQTIESPPKSTNSDSDKVFIVHGHNNELKQEVARTIEKLGLTPIILHEQPNEGKTVIEKFEKHSDVGFAIVLLTKDDMGKANSGENLTARARQNVILELGYFIGKLGRERVVPLYESSVELPSDLSGVVYVPADTNGTWKFAVVKELKAANYNVDANQIL